MTLKSDDGNNKDERSNKYKEPMMPMPRQTIIHLLLVALAVLASTAMSYAVGGDRSNSFNSVKLRRRRHHSPAAARQQKHQPRRFVCRSTWQTPSRTSTR